MEQTLTKDLLQQLRNEGYISLIAKGAPEQTGETYTQHLIASKQPLHNEETAEATWQFNINDESFLNGNNIRYTVERAD